MESKEELTNNRREREEYLEGECYQLGDLVDKMGGFYVLAESGSRDAEDLLEAFICTQEALKAVRRMIERNK